MCNLAKAGQNYKPCKIPHSQAFTNVNGGANVPVTSTTDAAKDAEPVAANSEDRPAAHSSEVKHW